MRAEVGAVAVVAASDRHGHVVGAGDAVDFEIDVELVLGEPACRRGGRLGPAAGVDVFVVEPLLELAGPMGRVAVDLGVVIIGAVVVTEEVVDEVFGDGRVAGVRRADPTGSTPPARCRTMRPRRRRSRHRGDPRRQPSSETSWVTVMRFGSDIVSARTP